MHNSRNFGFSLIELLIVIAVLATLMGVLFPVFRSMKEKTSGIECASNLRQVIMAWQIYADNNEGVACPASDYVMEGYKEYLWDMSVDNSNHKGPGYLSPYLKDGRIISCPEFRKIYLPSDLKYGCKGYGYNTTYIGGGSCEAPGWKWVKPCKVSAISQPSKTAVFSDVVGFNYIDTLKSKKRYLRVVVYAHQMKLIWLKTVYAVMICMFMELLIFGIRDAQTLLLLMDM